MKHRSWLLLATLLGACPGAPPALDVVPLAPVPPVQTTAPAARGGQ